jgi:hypothetical protein
LLFVEALQNSIDVLWIIPEFEESCEPSLGHVRMGVAIGELREDTRFVEF